MSSSHALLALFISVCLSSPTAARIFHQPLDLNAKNHQINDGILISDSFAGRTLQQSQSDQSVTVGALPDSAIVTKFEGDATAYSPSVTKEQAGKGFACSFRSLSPTPRRFFAAINSPQWSDGTVCGKCISIKCIDSFCPTQNKTVVVQVVDKCPECKVRHHHDDIYALSSSHLLSFSQSRHILLTFINSKFHEYYIQMGDVDLSYPAYQDVTGTSPNRLKASWEWADCGDLIEGTIQMDPKDGINAYWSAFYFSNYRYPLTSVRMNGVPLNRQTFNFWVHSAPLGSAPYTLELQSDNGHLLNVTVDDVLKSQDLGVQFPR